MTYECQKQTYLIALFYFCWGVNQGQGAQVSLREEETTNPAKETEICANTDWVWWEWGGESIDPWSSGWLLWRIFKFLSFVVVLVLSRQ